MANQKISELDAMTVFADDDELAIVNKSGVKTENITLLQTSSYFIQSLLTAQGDIAYASAANIVARLAKGSANEKLFMNAGATAPEWASGVKQGTFTRPMANGSATGVYTGVGFKPAAMLFFGAVTGTAIASLFGFSSASANAAIYDNANISADTFAVAGVAILLVEGAGLSQSAVISSFDPDGFSLDWTRTGATAVATANIFYLAFR